MKMTEAERIMSAHDRIMHEQRKAEERVQLALYRHVREQIPAWFLAYLRDNVDIDIADAIDCHIADMPADERALLERELEREIYAHEDTPPPIERPR